MRRSESAIHDSARQPPSALPAEAPAALIMKIFSLPKRATQSPRNGVFHMRRDKRRWRDDFASIKHQSEKVLQRRHFLHS
ncbi:hypothetical protein [Bradyrhizobium sp. Tv2a-2]|uniref:hypothetical protein n=1 Tax=Bradyrhizobium sp. Tv2a-2 TaxID=113395 RepID=UPI0018DB17FC|nr:hypothetical protein [Bradyrhizobium sp. Tv2a-2]